MRRNERVKHFVDEYRLAEKRLEEITSDYGKVDTSLKILVDLEKELMSEIEKAKESKDPQNTKYWQDILNNYFYSDQDRPDEETIKKAKDKISGENEKLIVYYERKLKMIERFLGSREVELLESYDRKNILMGSQHSTGRLSEEIEEDEENEREQEKKKKGFTFDKM